jgi:hypothetical protein
MLWAPQLVGFILTWLADVITDSGAGALARAVNSTVERYIAVAFGLFVARRLHSLVDSGVLVHSTKLVIIAFDDSDHAALSQFERAWQVGAVSVGALNFACLLDSALDNGLGLMHWAHQAADIASVLMMGSVALLTFRFIRRAAVAVYPAGSAPAEEGYPAASAAATPAAAAPAAAEFTAVEDGAPLGAGWIQSVPSQTLLMGVKAFACWLLFASLSQRPIVFLTLLTLCLAVGMPVYLAVSFLEASCAHRKEQIALILRDHEPTAVNREDDYVALRRQSMVYLQLEVAALDGCEGEHLFSVHDDGIDKFVARRSVADAGLGDRVAMASASAVPCCLGEKSSNRVIRFVVYKALPFALSSAHYAALSCIRGLMHGGLIVSMLYATLFWLVFVPDVHQRLYEREDAEPACLRPGCLARPASSHGSVAETGRYLAATITGALAIAVSLTFLRSVPGILDRKALARVIASHFAAGELAAFVVTDQQELRRWHAARIVAEKALLEQWSAVGLVCSWFCAMTWTSASLLLYVAFARANFVTAHWIDGLCAVLLLTALTARMLEAVVHLDEARHGLELPLQRALRANMLLRPGSALSPEASRNAPALLAAWEGRESPFVVLDVLPGTRLTASVSKATLLSANAVLIVKLLAELGAAQDPEGWDHSLLLKLLHAVPYVGDLLGWVIDGANGDGGDA